MQSTSVHQGDTSECKLNIVIDTWAISFCCFNIYNNYIKVTWNMEEYLKALCTNIILRYAVLACWNPNAQIQRDHKHIIQSNI